MNWGDYRKAMDALPFSPDFQERTEKLLRLSAQNEAEKEPFAMKKKLFHKIAAAAAVLALLTASAYAAVKLLSPSQVAEFAQQPLLAEAFRSEDALVLNETVESGGYRMTLAGLVSGAVLDSWDQDVDRSRTYAVAALERLDGQPLDQQSVSLSDFILTPLVAGYTPWSVNNWTLDAAVCGIAQDGVFYFLLDVQTLEMFADHTVYLAFYEGGVPSREIFVMNGDGSIQFAGDFAGPHALFTLPLDAGKADPAAVEAFIADSGFDLDWFTGSTSQSEEPSFTGQGDGELAEAPSVELEEIPSGET